jgi:excisionase family DNA binding protein
LNPERTTSTDELSSTYSRPRLLTAAEAAEWLSIRESTLRDLARRGIVPSVKIGRLMRFVEADLLAYVDGLRKGS